METPHPNSFDWILPDRLAACPHPGVSSHALAALRTHRIALLINLHERANSPEVVQALGARELHLPVSDSLPPTPAQLEQGVAAIASALAAGDRVAVHCGAGLGRSGTLIAAYLVETGMSPDGAIQHVRAARPGSVETADQEAAVALYAARHGR